MGATLANVLPHLKEHYHDSVTELFFKVGKLMSPILSAAEAKAGDDGFGRGYQVPITTSLGSSASATFSVAQGKAQGSTVGSVAARDRWTVQAVTIDGVAYWSRDSMLAAEGEGSDKLLDIMTSEMDAKIELIRKRLTHACNEKGFGRVGVISALTSSSITISTSQVNRLDVGDELVASATESANALRATANTGNRVTGWNPDTGVINVATDPTGGGGAWQAGDTVFFYGDRQDTGSPVEIMPYGVPAWVPTAAPSSTTFCNINRQNNPNLGGHRYAAVSGQPIQAALIRTANRLFQYGSSSDMCVLSPHDFGTLCIDKDAVKVVELKVGKYEIGFDGVAIRTNGGMVPVVPEAMCEQGNAWMGPFKDSKFRPLLLHNKDLVNIDDIDGNQIRANATSTNLEMRMYFRGNFIMPGPGKFAVTTGLPTS